MSLRCFFGCHDWTRIGSAPVILVTVVTDDFDDPQTDERPGFVLLLECLRCGTEAGRGEAGNERRRYSAAYARSFIEESPEGHIRKGEA